MVELRWAQIILSSVALIFWLLLAVRYERYLGYIIAPILFLLHIVVFNVARLFGFPADASWTNLWSISIRIMGVLAAGILGGGILFDLRNNGYNGHVK
jgi:hypothetical protein